MVVVPLRSIIPSQRSIQDSDPGKSRIWILNVKENVPFFQIQQKNLDSDALLTSLSYKRTKVYSV